MAYFVRENPRHEREAKSAARAGIRSFGATQAFAAANPIVHPTLDEVKEREAAKMAAHEEFVTKLDKTQGRKTGKHTFTVAEKAAHGATSHVFDAPKLDPQPRPRIRTGVTDEELRAIWVEDERKDRAAKAMECADHGDLVHMMCAEKRPGVHGSKEAPVVRKAPGALPVAAVNEAEPAGFRGMGAHCQPTAHRGIACVKPIDFDPPKFEDVIKPRMSGRRAIAPPDTFNMKESQDVLAPFVPDRTAYGFRTTALK